MTYEDNLRNDIGIAIGLMRNNQSMDSKSIDFIIDATMERLEGKSVSDVELKYVDRVLAVIEMEETLGLQNLQDKALILSHDLEDALKLLIRMKKVEVYNGIVSIIK